MLLCPTIRVQGARPYWPIERRPYHYSNSHQPPAMPMLRGLLGDGNDTAQITEKYRIGGVMQSPSLTQKSN